MFHLDQFMYWCFAENGKDLRTLVFQQPYTKQLKKFVGFVNNIYQDPTYLKSLDYYKNKLSLCSKFEYTTLKMSSL